jgi:hypothetical protein
MIDRRRLLDLMNAPAAFAPGQSATWRHSDVTKSAGASADLFWSDETGVITGSVAEWSRGLAGQERIIAVEIEARPFTPARDLFSLSGAIYGASETGDELATVFGEHVGVLILGNLTERTAA